MFTSSVIIHAHRRRLPQGNGGDCPRRNTPHRAPPGEDFDPPYDIKLVFVQKITFVLSESTKTAATRAALFDSNMHQIVCWLGLLPTPNWESLQCSPDTLGVFRGPTSRKRRGRKGEKKEREEGRETREEEMRKGDRGGEGREFVFCPRKKKEK